MSTVHLSPDNGHTTACGAGAGKTLAVADGLFWTADAQTVSCARCRATIVFEELLAAETIEALHRIGGSADNDDREDAHDFYDHDERFF